MARPNLRGVTVILRNDAGDVLFVRHSYGADMWTLPGGGMGRAEEPEETARREMREELGVELEELTLIGVLDETLSGASHKAWIYTANPVGVVRADGREILRTRFAPADDAPQPLGRIAAARLALLRGKSA